MLGAKWKVLSTEEKQPYEERLPEGEGGLLVGGRPGEARGRGHEAARGAADAVDRQGAPGCSTSSSGRRLRAGRGGTQILSGAMRPDALCAGRRSSGPREW